MATLQDIADKLGISKGTVSKALNDAPDISESLQKTVIDTAVEMGYHKIQRSGKSRRLCVLIQRMEYQAPGAFGYDLILGFRQMAEPAGYTVDVIPVTEGLQHSLSYDSFMLQYNYLGAFVLGFSLEDPWMKEFPSSHTPAVLYDNYVSANPCMAAIGIDNREGMELAVSHLKSLGHRKIGYLSHALDSHIMQVRLDAFLKTMKQQELSADLSDTGSSHYTSCCVEKHLPRLLSEKQATAIICSHDLIASAALVQCQQMGYRVPEDISIIGFDDLPICAYTSPPLTTVRQDRLQLGKSGYAALESLRNPVPIGTLLLHAELIVRNSTGPVKPVR